MPEEQSEVQKLFTRPNEQAFELQEQVPEQGEELPEDAKNRHVRRLEAKLERERQSNMELAARVNALSEVQKFRQDVKPDELDELVSRIYGTDKPEAAAATELLQKALKGYSERAKSEAIQEFRREFQARQEEEQRDVETVQNYIEQIEDQYGVDFSSSPAARQKQEQFRDLWYRLSPKDENGEVKEFADPYEVYEIFSQRQSTNPAKDFASRSMVRSAPIQESVQEDATTKYLRENGIIDPF